MLNFPIKFTHFTFPQFYVPFLRVQADSYDLVVGPRFWDLVLGFRGLRKFESKDRERLCMKNEEESLSGFYFDRFMSLVNIKMTEYKRDEHEKRENVSEEHQSHRL